MVNEREQGLRPLRRSQTMRVSRYQKSYSSCVRLDLNSNGAKENVLSP